MFVLFLLACSPSTFACGPCPNRRRCPLPLRTSYFTAELPESFIWRSLFVGMPASLFTRAFFRVSDTVVACFITFSFLLSSSFFFFFFSVLGFSDYPTTFQAPSHHPLPCMNKVHLRLTKTSLIIITFQNFPTYVFAYYFRALAVCNFVRAIFFATFSFNHPRGAPSSPSAAPVVRKTLTCRRQSRPRCARGGRGQTPSPRPRAYRRPPPPRARPMTPSRW